MITCLLINYVDLCGRYCLQRGRDVLQCFQAQGLLWYDVFYKHLLPYFTGPTGAVKCWYSCSVSSAVALSISLLYLSWQHYTYHLVQRRPSRVYLLNLQLGLSISACVGSQGFYSRTVNVEVAAAR